MIAAKLRVFMHLWKMRKCKKMHQAHVTCAQKRAKYAKCSARYII